jgi:hypothetical protein
MEVSFICGGSQRLPEKKPQTTIKNRPYQTIWIFIIKSKIYVIFFYQIWLVSTPYDNGNGLKGNVERVDFDSLYFQTFSCGEMDRKGCHYCMTDKHRA